MLFDGRWLLDNEIDIYYNNYLPQAGGLRYCNAAAFSSLKKYATHFFNLAFGDTEEKKAAYAVAGVNSKEYLLNYSFLIRKL
jgi:hypothetical protein